MEIILSIDKLCLVASKSLGVSNLADWAEAVLESLGNVQKDFQLEISVDTNFGEANISRFEAMELDIDGIKVCAVVRRESLGNVFIFNLITIYTKFIPEVLYCTEFILNSKEHRL